MTEHGPFDDTEAARDELQSASRLADALEGDSQGGADVDALAVVRLLEALSVPTTDETAVRRLRNELTARAPRRPRLSTSRRIVPIAAALAGIALLSVFFLRSPARTSESALLAREEAARAAVVAVAESWRAQDEPTRRIAAVSDQQWRLRLVDQAESERFEQLASESSAGSANGDRDQQAPPSTRAIPTPGGSS